MSSVVETRPAGWRPDPSGRYEWRYWDNGWTNRVANSATTTQAATARPEPRAIDAAPVGDPTPTVSLRGGFVSSAASPGGYSTAPPPSASEQAVLDAVRAGRPPVKPRSAQASPRPGELPPAPGARAPRSRLWAAIVAWFRSLAEEPESYHSPKAGIDLPPHPNSNTILASSPANYGRAGLVALAACGLGVGAYLPWLSGTVDTVPFERTGLELGKAWGFTWLAAAIAISAILGVRLRPIRWINMGLAVVAAALTARELIDTHSLVEGMNAAAIVRADVGIGLWIMLVSAAGVLIASFRIGTPE